MSVRKLLSARIDRNCVANLPRINSCLSTVDFRSKR